MTSYQSENITESRGDEDYRSANGEDMELELEKLDAEFEITNSTPVISSRRKSNCESSSDDLAPKRKTNIPAAGIRKTVLARRDFQPVRTKSSVVKNVTSVNSSIPLRVKSSGPVKHLPKNPSKSVSRTSTISLNRPIDKHTLEIQFFNKNKTYTQLRKDLLEKQKPVLDLYQNLLKIKKRLEELGGKKVNLEEVKVVPFGNLHERDGAGEQIPIEVISNMKTSIKEIPRTLMDICQNLLSRRALIVELLESVTKSELEMSEVSDKIESLKSEGMQLQSSLDAVYAEHESKINELINGWQNLMADKQTANNDVKIEELEAKLKEKERLTIESNYLVQDLQKKLDERKINHDKSVAELNGVIHTLKDQIRKIEQDLESERKTSVDTKSRMSTNSQAMKNLKNKMAEIENEKKATDTHNFELQRKLRILQDQIKNKETQWNREKEEMNKNLKHQENLLQKITQDKTNYESRLQAVEGQKESTEEELIENIANLTTELNQTQNRLDVVTKERDEAIEKCSEFELYITRMGSECKENINKLACNMNWGKTKGNANYSETENYIQDIAKDVKIQELEDQIKELEQDKWMYNKERLILMDQSKEPTDAERELYKQQECVNRYQKLLEESENKLKEKSMEVANLRSEIRQLKVRQEALEEQNYSCPTEELQRMVEESRNKLNKLMEKSMESEQKLEQYKSEIDDQRNKASEMENKLMHREHFIGVLTTTRDELCLENKGLTKFSLELKEALREVVKENQMKDRLLKELQDQRQLRDEQLAKYEKEIRQLEERLQMTNEKRFKLQETISAMEKELQSTKKFNHQLADINTRSTRNK